MVTPNLNLLPYEIECILNNTVENFPRLKKLKWIYWLGIAHSTFSPHPYLKDFVGYDITVNDKDIIYK